MSKPYKKIWINGCFDVLHYGHFKMFEYAAQVGQIVIVAIDTDERIKELKGSCRPVNTLERRIFALQSIRYIDSVLSFGTDQELIALIRLVRPDMMIIGQEYENKRIVGREYIPKVHFFPRYDSSTRLILCQEETITKK